MSASSQLATQPVPPLWYQVLIRLIIPIYRWRVHRRSGDAADYDEEVQQRFGPLVAPQHQHSIWFHAVSVGETNAAAPLIQHYLNQGLPVLVTNTTRTGQARARALFAHTYPSQFQAVFLPVDERALVEAFILRYQPRILLLIETELWPNLIAALCQHHVPIALLNARLSERSARGYARFSRLTRPMLRQLNVIAAQDEATRQRFIQLAAPVDRIHTVGSIKYDIQPPAEIYQQAQDLRQHWQLQSRKIFILASTHAPEEQLLLTQLVPYLQADSRLLCIVVPRHPERFDEVAKLIETLNLNLQRRSLAQTIQPTTSVFLADSMGEMWLWYALAHVAYVGGSLNTPGGGHNILEPIACGVATIVGQRYFNFQSTVDAFVAQEAILVAADAKQAVQQLMRLLEDNPYHTAIVERATTLLHANQGSLQRHLTIIDDLLAVSS